MILFYLAYMKLNVSLRCLRQRLCISILDSGHFLCLQDCYYLQRYKAIKSLLDTHIYVLYLSLARRDAIAFFIYSNFIQFMPRTNEIRGKKNCTLSVVHDNQKPILPLLNDTKTNSFYLVDTNFEYIFAVIQDQENHQIRLLQTTFSYRFDCVVSQRYRAVQFPLLPFANRCKWFSWSRIRGWIALLIFYSKFIAMTKRMNLGEKRSTVTSTSTANSRKTVSYREYEIEMNAKNTAYYFILSNNLLNEFTAFCKNHHSDDPRTDCLEYLLSRFG